MTIVADIHVPAQALMVTGGVDTHAVVHVAAVIDPVGRELGWAAFGTDPAGYLALMGWLASFGSVEVVGVEGTGVYGAGLAALGHAASNAPTWWVVGMAICSPAVIADGIWLAFRLDRRP